MKHLAVLIDADNVPASVADGLFLKIETLGEPIVKRIYGALGDLALASWDDAMRTHSISPVTHQKNTVHKNASDIALVIDAIDLLHSGKYGGFCIVSSDSDFTGLAERIRREGVLVYGFGEEKTPASFIKNCSKFFTIVFRTGPAKLLATAEPAPLPKTPRKSPPAKKTAPARKKVNGAKVAGKKGKPLPVDLLKTVVGKNNGWKPLSQIGKELKSKQSGFKPQNYGHATLKKLIVASGLFELQPPGKKSEAGQASVRLKASSGKNAG